MQARPWTTVPRAPPAAHRRGHRRGLCSARGGGSPGHSTPPLAALTARARDRPPSYATVRALTPTSARRADEQFWAELELADTTLGLISGRLGKVAPVLRPLHNALLAQKHELASRARPPLANCRRPSAAWADANRPCSVPPPAPQELAAVAAAPGVASAQHQGGATAAAAAVTPPRGATPNKRGSLQRKLSPPQLAIEQDPIEACDLAKSCRRNQHPLSVRGASPPDYEQDTLPVSAMPTLTSAGLDTPVCSPKNAKARERLAQDGRGRQELTVFEAHDLSLRFNLPTGHVTQAWKLFKRYDRKGHGLLGIHEFQMLLRSLLRDRYPQARDVPRELFDRLSDHQEVDFTEFLTWITRNSFSELLLLTPGQRVIRDIARKFHRPVPFVEAIKLEFDRFDSNGSGVIDYKEFCELLSLLLGVSDPCLLPENRVRSFWRELDDNNSGEVDFSEFIPWYITYFDISSKPQGTSPLEEFYRKIRPVPFAPPMS